MDTALPDPFTIADGMGAEEIRRRAIQACDRLEDVFTRYRSVPDIHKRVTAILAWFSWREILLWMRDRDRQDFSLADWEDEDDSSLLARARDSVAGLALQLAWTSRLIWAILSCRLPRHYRRLP